MTLEQLTKMTHFYTRDSNGIMFSDKDIKTYLNQAIDRIKQFDKCFKQMKYLVEIGDEPNIIPEHYDYMLALFAAHRCYDNDERFYEGTQKRNEFEELLSQLVSELQAGNETLIDDDGNSISYADAGNAYIEYVKDEYFKTHNAENI